MKIEEKYKILDHISHILLRPSTYCGSNKPNCSNKWIYSDKMNYEEITYIPSFLKLFDEIIMNSIDESKRNPKLNTINITIKDNKISVKDDGGIEVVLHKEHNIYVPTLIFGSLMSGSNFSDDEDRVVAGTNGLGCKLVNIFSKEFIVSTCDGKNSFYQVFTNNMRDRTEVKIKKSKLNHTEITYSPDYEKFGMEGLDESHFNLIKKRVIDIAGCNPSLKIYFNGELIQVKSFQDYIKLYKEEFLFEKNSDNSWSIGIAPSNDGFRQVSFVNSIETFEGGNHVDYILNQIIVQLREFFQKKHKVDIKPSEIKNHIFLFLNATVVNPAFGSQTKEKLITEVKDFGYTYEVSSKLIKDIIKSEIVESILDWINKKELAEENKLIRGLNKNLGKVKVDKLIDAKGKNRSVCSLSIYEGESAIASFRTHRDPQTQGAFALKGKFVNATDLSIQKLVLNTEVVNFISAMGLRLGEKADIEKLRYGKILITTDSDFDGTSITALLINFLYKYWPELFDNEIVYRVETPIVVSTNLKTKNKISFYNNSDYKKWLTNINNKDWKIGFKKGLAALSNDEYKEMITKPRLILFNNDELAKVKLNVWFGDNKKFGELRKNEIMN